MTDKLEETKTLLDSITYHNRLGSGDIEKLDWLIEQTEKQMPQKVIKIEGVSSQACPVCKSNVNGQYCSSCGQKLKY